MYKKHTIKTRTDLYREIEAGPINNERKMMLKLLKYCVNYLDNNRVYFYQDFIISLKNFGLKNNDINNFILDFHKYINKQNQNEDISSINWINRRCIIKSNFNEKNLIINCLVHKYPNEILYFIHYFIQEKYPNLLKVEIFFQEFQNKIDQLLCSAINIESTKEI